MIPEPYTLSDADLEALPGPIAIPAARYAKENDPRIKLLLMIDTIETIFKYGSAIVIQAMRNGDSWQDFIRSTRPKPLLQMLGRLQLGEHIGIIQAAYFFLRNNPRSARPSILKMVTPLSEPGLCNALKTLRNRRKGHGAWPSVEVAQVSLTEFQHNFAHLVQLVKTLNLTYPLCLEAPTTQSATQFCGPTLSEEVSDSSRLVLRENGVTILGLYPFFLATGSGSVIYNGTGDWGSDSEGAVTFLDYGSGADTDLSPGNTIAEDFKASYLGSSWEMDLPRFQGALKEITGRANDRRILDAFLLQERTNLILIHGERGVGKTTLLDKWWQNFAPRSCGPSEAMCSIRHVIHEGSSLADPREIAKSLLHQLNPNARVEFDWTASRFRHEIQECLDAGSERHPCLILIDGLDECANKLGGIDCSLFDWIPSPSSTGPWVKWILGLRSHYLKSPEIRSLVESCTPMIHEVSVFTPAEVTEYLRKSLDARTVDQRPEVLLLILERTRGLPLNLHLLVQGIREGDGKYSESYLHSFDLDENAILRKGIQQLTLDAGRMEEYLERDEFEKQEKLYSRKRAEGIISLSDYQSRCRALKADYRSAGEQRFTGLLGLFTLGKEFLTESSITSILGIPEERTHRYLNLASRFLKPEQDGYRFSNVAFPAYIAAHFGSVLDSLRTRISTWCGDPANRTHGYTIRNGVAHLIDDYSADPLEEKAERLASLLTDLDFITVKVRAGLVPELLQDYEQALTCLTGSPSSMFHDLEVDDEDRSWILQNHLARRAGLPIPFPGRGGDLVIEAIQQRLIEEKAEQAAKVEIRKMRNVAEGRDPDYYPSWDFDDLDSPDENGESHSDPEEGPKIGVISPELAKELELREQEMEAKALLAKRGRDKAAAEAFNPASATARAVAKMLTPATLGDADTPEARMEAFRAFVEQMWRKVADESLPIFALCINYRMEGSVRRAGLTAHEPGSIWVENLYPPSQDVRRMALPFKTYGMEDEAEVCFFAGFRRCLRVAPTSWNGKETVYAFECVDVVSNKIAFTVHLEPGSVGGSCLRAGRLRVSEDGNYGRLDNSYFRLDWESALIEVIPHTRVPLPYVVEIRRAENKSTLQNRRQIQIRSEDSALCMETDMDHGLNLQASGLAEHSLPMMDRLKFKNASFSEDGRFVFVSSTDWFCALDLISWRRVFQADHEYGNIAQTPDGRLLAADSNGEIRVWDVSTGKMIRRFVCNGVGSEMHFSRSGELLYVRGSVCDLRTGTVPADDFFWNWVDQFFKENATCYKISESVAYCTENDTCYSSNAGFPPKIENKHHNFTFLNLGDRLIAAAEWDLAIASFPLGGVWTHFSPSDYLSEVFEDQAKRPKCEIPGMMTPSRSRDTGMTLLPYGNGNLYLMDPLDASTKPINSPDDLAPMDVTVGEKMLERYIESPWERERRQSSERWASQKGEVFSPEIKVPQFYINAAVISDDGQWVLTATHWDAVRVWDVTTGRCVRDFQLPPAADFFAGHVEAISLTPDGRGCYLALRDGNTHLLESWQKDKCNWNMILRLEAPHEVYCRALLNRRFAIRQTCLQDVAEVHDLRTGTAISLAPLSRWFGSMSYFECNLLITPDDLHLIAAHEDTLVVFTLEGLQEITRFPLPAKVKSLSNMTPDGRFVVHTEAGDLLRLKLHLPSQ